MKWYSAPVDISPTAVGWSTCSIIMPTDAVAAIVAAKGSGAYVGFRASSADTTAFSSVAHLYGSASALFFTPISSGGTFDVFYSGSGPTILLVGYVTDDEAEAYDPMPVVSIPFSSGYTTLNWGAYAAGASAIGVNLCWSGTTTAFDFRHPDDYSEHQKLLLDSSGWVVPCNDSRQVSYSGPAAPGYIAFGFKSGKTRAIIPREVLTISNTAFALLASTNDFGWGGRIVGSGTTTAYALNDLKQAPFERTISTTKALPHIFPIPHSQVGGYATSAPVDFIRDLAIVGIHDADVFDWRPSGVGYAKQTVLNFDASDSYVITTRGTSNRITCTAVQAKIDSFNMEGDVDFNYYGTKVTINTLREITVPLSSAGQDISFSSVRGGLLIVTLYTDPRDIRARE